MAYSVELSAPATRQLDALPDKIYDQVRVRIDALAADPRPPGVKKLKGLKGALPRSRRRLQNRLPDPGQETPRPRRQGWQPAGCLQRIVSEAWVRASRRAVRPKPGHVTRARVSSRPWNPSVTTRRGRPGSRLTTSRYAIKPSSAPTGARTNGVRATARRRASASSGRGDTSGRHRGRGLAA